MTTFGIEATFNICPRCLKRMKRYLAREAKREEKMNKEEQDND